MKTFLIAFLLGIIAGGLIVVALTTHEPSAGTVSSAAPEQPGTAQEMRNTIADKLEQWHLTPEDIKSDLAKTGEVVRTKAAATGKKLSDARVVAVIKAKYVLDSDLSAIDINVDCHDGEVTLTGKVTSPELIGRAIMIALDTGGVRHVVSKLTAGSS